MECPVCKNEFDPYTGRRPKKFCSDGCKIQWHNVSKKVVENNKPGNKAMEDFEKGLMLAGLVTPANVQELEERTRLEEYEKALARIEELQKELKTPPKSVSIGISVWKRVRENEIKELRQKHGI